MTGNSSAILVLKDVSKAFGGMPVLQHVDLEVPRGSIVSLLGASGSGKTTLLQIIAGLQEPDGGKLSIDGRDMQGVPAFARPVNMMFQSYALFPHLTVRGNVEYGLKARGVDRHERQRLVAWALQLARIEEFAGRRPDQLSGGQRQRVALARCLVMKPAILLLDEPMAALDRGLRAQVQRELISIQRAVGTTFIVVTHDQEEALAMSDHIAVMDRGQIVQFGEPRALYERPRSRFVASVLGNINLFDGSAEALGPCRALFRTSEGLEFVINHEVDLQLATIDAAGFRPERLVVSADPAGVANELPGTVEQVTYGGKLTRATIRIAGGRMLDATLVNVRGSTGACLTAGDAVHVGFPADAAVVLTE